MAIIERGSINLTNVAAVDAAHPIKSLFGPNSPSAAGTNFPDFDLATWPAGFDATNQVAMRYRADYTDRTTNDGQNGYVFLLEEQTNSGWEDRYQSDFTIFLEVYLQGGWESPPGIGGKGEFMRLRTRTPDGSSVENGATFRIDTNGSPADYRTEVSVVTSGGSSVTQFGTRLEGSQKAVLAIRWQAAEDGNPDSGVLDAWIAAGLEMDEITGLGDFTQVLSGVAHNSGALAEIQLAATSNHADIAMVDVRVRRAAWSDAWDTDVATTFEGCRPKHRGLFAGAEVPYLSGTKRRTSFGYRFDPGLYGVGAGVTVELEIATDSAFGNVVATAAPSALVSPWRKTWRVTLDGSTLYYARAIVTVDDGGANEYTFETEPVVWRTRPALNQGTAATTIAHSSCEQTDQKWQPARTMATLAGLATAPDLFVHGGDVSYADNRLGDREGVDITAPWETNATQAQVERELEQASTLNPIHQEAAATQRILYRRSDHEIEDGWEGATVAAGVYSRGNDAWNACFGWCKPADGSPYRGDPADHSGNSPAGVPWVAGDIHYWYDLTPSELMIFADFHTFQDKSADIALGAVQTAWIVDKIRTSRRRFTVVFLPNRVTNYNRNKMGGTMGWDDVHAVNFSTERDEIIAAHKLHNPGGILIFLTGDDHHVSITRGHGCAGNGTDPTAEDRIVEAMAGGVSTAVHLITDVQEPTDPDYPSSTDAIWEAGTYTVYTDLGRDTVTNEAFRAFCLTTLDGDVATLEAFNGETGERLGDVETISAVAAGRRTRSRDRRVR